VRPRIYLLHLRQFTNSCENRRPNGTLAENGVGKFQDLTPHALLALREFGVTHLWLLGVPRQATGTDHSSIGLPADDPDLLKGIAGSPYAIRDVFDVCPDYATDPARRREEFRELVERIHAAGLKVLIDFVPNHVARSHRSVVHPDLDFGLSDDATRFFSPSNNFFHLPGHGPLRLPTVHDGVPVSPTCQVLGGCDGTFGPESIQARVTGNNVTSPTPSIHDWYETVKLNYGIDFTRGRQAPRHFPTTSNPTHPNPDTWLRMDAVLAHWQDFGVDGFRCDMAHWIPTEFWSWAVHRARTRHPGTSFVAEAYEDDPNKLCEGSTLEALVAAGFDAVYDHAAYRILKDLQDGPKWANDLDHSFADPIAFRHSLRYVENHDEVRVAHHAGWGGHGARIGFASAAVQFGSGVGPVLVYGGQEVAEPAEHPEGFGGGSGRTSLFDYGSMPQVARWVNGLRFDGGRLDASERRLRDDYQRLLLALDHPALRAGNFHPLNPANITNPDFGRAPGDPASGHWIYAWVRHDPLSRATILAVVNLHGHDASTAIRIRLPNDLRPLLGQPNAQASWRNLLDPDQPVEVLAESDSLLLPPIPPATALFLEQPDQRLLVGRVSSRAVW
jgi:glycosidase